jgi:tetratricopeptide (TPR) repeat protein
LLKRILLSIALGVVGLAGWSSSAWAAPVTSSSAVIQDLRFGRADDALQRLNAMLNQSPDDAQAHNLRCRVYYQEQQWDPAVADCEAAVKLQPDNSNFHLWLGRAYGLRAEHVSMMSGYKLAHKVAAEFQKAAQLDPRNAAALSDLGEFDTTAPRVAGGGSGHASSIVPQLQAVSPAAALQLEARIAENRKDYAAAESDLKKAITVSPDPAQAWMDLGSFYRKHGRMDDMIAAVHNGAAVDPQHGPALVDGAMNLSQAGREPATAIRWLQQYIASGAQSEDTPAFAVHAELAKLLAQQGEEQAAQQQIAAAHALASGYRISPQNLSARAGQ